jgi:hypothetical protein
MPAKTAVRKRGRPIKEDKIQTVQIPLLLDEEILQAIEDYRFATRASTRMEALRSLIRLGLETHKRGDKGARRGQR